MGEIPTGAGVDGGSDSGAFAIPPPKNANYNYLVRELHSFHAHFSLHSAIAKNSKPLLCTKAN